MDYLLCILSDENSSVLNDDNDENVSSSANSDSYDDSYTLQEIALSVSKKTIFRVPLFHSVLIII